MTTSDDNLELYWDLVRMVPRDRTVAESLQNEFRTTPGDLIIGTSAQRLLVLIKANGELQYGPEYTPDETAEVFWEAMARKRVEAEERLILFAHMERLLSQIGRQDMEVERLRLRAQEEDLEDTEKASREQYSELALRRLEMLVHQAIELGRGLVRRPEVDFEGTGT